VLQITPSEYREYVAKLKDASLCFARHKRDGLLRTQIERIWQVNFKVNGSDKVCRQIKREGVIDGANDGLPVARCTVERLMRDIGLRGVRRGKHVRTTVANEALLCRLERVNPQFKAQRPNALWVSDFTHVSTQQGMV
jgi:putative transposase